ncbi:ankyrin repeat domain-containing protein [Methylobacter sp.]|uniref:ankyrin repeat domain-containing protein n=1 Tax=Methylobacter sp. TaxID=2051955 RepID=UPI0026006E56|nr:ankyrin repeat domain-containing protein [Methylobacter sp.]
MQSNKGESALHVAASYGTIDVVERLLDKGANVNAETNFGGSPLDRVRKKDIAELLLARGAIVEQFRCESSNGNGSTTTTVRHGQCPSPNDVRTLLPVQKPLYENLAVNPESIKKEEAVEPLSTRKAKAELIRCTSSDGKSSTLQRGKCASPNDTRVPETAVKPLLERSESNTALIKCTSPNGKKISFQRGNCASPEDYQQLLR